MTIGSSLHSFKCRYLRKTLEKVPEDADEKKTHDEYEIKHNRIYRKTACGPKWLVPKYARRQIVMFHHDGKGHLGLDKTLDSISR